MAPGRADRIVEGDLVRVELAETVRAAGLEPAAVLDGRLFLAAAFVG